MKVLQVASGDLWAGAEVQFYYLCRYLQREAVDVHVVLFNEGILAQRLRDLNIPVVVFDEARLGARALFTGFMRHLRQLRPDLIHTHRYKENILASVANALTVRAACVRTVHGGQEFSLPWWKVPQRVVHGLNVWCGRLLQQKVIAVSAELGESLARVYGKQRMVVIENAIDVDYVESVAHAKPALAVAQDKTAIAIVGRLVPVKRHDLLLQALRQVVEVLPDAAWHLYVIGDGPLSTSVLAQVDALGLNARVTLTGAIDPVYPLLARMDMLVMPSDHEGLPMALLEAMALEVPVIAHATGGIVEVVQQGRLARLVTEHSLAGYRDAIVEGLRDMDTARQRAQLARQHIRDRYDVATRCVDFMRLYRSLLG